MNLPPLIDTALHHMETALRGLDRPLRVAQTDYWPLPYPPEGVAEHVTLGGKALLPQVFRMFWGEDPLAQKDFWAGIKNDWEHHLNTRALPAKVAERFPALSPRDSPLGATVKAIRLCAGGGLEVSRRSSYMGWALGKTSGGISVGDFDGIGRPLPDYVGVLRISYFYFEDLVKANQNLSIPTTPRLRRVLRELCTLFPEDRAAMKYLFWALSVHGEGLQRLGAAVEFEALATDKEAQASAKEAQASAKVFGGLLLGAGPLSEEETSLARLMSPEMVTEFADMPPDFRWPERYQPASDRDYSRMRLRLHQRLTQLHDRHLCGM